MLPKCYIWTIWCYFKRLRDSNARRTQRRQRSQIRVRKLHLLVKVLERCQNGFFSSIFKSCLIMSRDVENDDEDVDSEHEKRKRRVMIDVYFYHFWLSNLNFHCKFHFKLRLTDPVYSISIKDYCIQKLRECETCFGTEFFHQLMNNVDKSVVDKLNELLSSWENVQMKQEKALSSFVLNMTRIFF